MLFQQLVLNSVSDMMMNKFNSPVTDPKYFLGRRALISKIYARIGAGRPQSVSIVGDIKIGKSSLLGYLAHEDVKRQMLKNPDEYIFLYIPCRNDNLLTLGTFTGMIYRMTRKYTENSDNTSIQLEYNYFKRLVENLHKQNKKIILFMDDFNLITLNPAFPLEFFSFLRSLANNYNLAYITTSYEDLQKLCVSKDIEESPFFNIFTNMSLRGLEADEIDTLIQIASDDFGNNIEEYKDYLINLVGNGPYPLQLACHYLQKYKKEQGDFTPDVKEQFEALIYENLHGYYEQLWKHMEESYQLILSCLAVKKPIPEAKQYLIRDLIKKNYIVSNNGQSQLSSTLLQNFVLENSDSSSIKSNPNMQLKAFISRLISHLLNRK
jgi:serine/threonine-protein kinase